jgi:dTDP-4-dehydrorhamnose 3,5-epimerase
VIFTETPLTGAFVIDIEPINDERGFFARLWCQREFEAHGLESNLVQCSMSFNNRAGTLRGLHYQVAPFSEAKTVRCTCGSVFDVIVDLRPGSSTFARHFSVTLSAANRRMLYIPRGFAHGFQTLDDNSEMFYQMSAFFEPAAARGVRWDDPVFAIDWPAAANRIINERDRTYPDFRPITNGDHRSHALLP